MRRAAAFALLAACAAGARCPAGALGGGTESCALRSHGRALYTPPGGLDLVAGLPPRRQLLPLPRLWLGASIDQLLNCWSTA